jgi:hypothetical protein
VNPVNPLVPPFEDAEDVPQKSRLMGTTAWIMLVILVGVGVGFFEFQTQLMTSFTNIMKTLGYI